MLAERFERVTVVERDALADGAPVFRPGVPQSRHVHILWSRGIAVALSRTVVHRRTRNALPVRLTRTPGHHPAPPDRRPVRRHRAAPPRSEWTRGGVGRARGGGRKAA
ncbi:hypothetical protein ACFRK5_08530 [Streptomyces niveus]|uniref:hypothetical protein n=1 Tax=Streptomyces niveus TaxID=193462 RepID=UPI0036BF53A9